MRGREAGRDTIGEKAESIGSYILTDQGIEGMRDGMEAN